MAYKFKKILKFSVIGLAVLLFLLVVYLIKCAMGINLFPHFSLGIWAWFKPWVQNIFPHA
jgi:hypothetical protein